MNYSRRDNFLRQPNTEPFLIELCKLYANAPDSEAFWMDNKMFLRFDIKEITRKSGMSRSSAYQKIDKLKGLGIIEAFRKDQDTGNAKVYYHLNKQKLLFLVKIHRESKEYIELFSKLNNLLRARTSKILYKHSPQDFREKSKHIYGNLKNNRKIYRETHTMELKPQQSVPRGPLTEKEQETLNHMLKLIHENFNIHDKELATTPAEKWVAMFNKMRSPAEKRSLLFNFYNVFNGDFELVKQHLQFAAEHPMLIGKIKPKDSNKRFFLSIFVAMSPKFKRDLESGKYLHKSRYRANSTESPNYKKHAESAPPIRLSTFKRMPTALGEILNKHTPMDALKYPPSYVASLPPPVKIDADDPWRSVFESVGCEYETTSKYGKRYAQTA